MRWVVVRCRNVAGSQARKRPIEPENGARDGVRGQLCKG